MERTPSVALRFLTVRRVGVDGAALVTLANQAPCLLPAPAPEVLYVGEPLFALVSSLAEAFELDTSERVVVRMLLRGQGTPRIAARLKLSPRMAAWRIQDVFAKTGAESPRALLYLAQEQLRVREPADIPTREIPRWATVNAGA